MQFTAGFLFYNPTVKWVCRCLSQLEDEALKHIGAHCPELVTLNLQTCSVSIFNAAGRRLKLIWKNSCCASLFVCFFFRALIDGHTVLEQSSLSADELSIESIDSHFTILLLHHHLRNSWFRLLCLCRALLLLPHTFSSPLSFPEHHFKQQQQQQQLCQENLSHWALMFGAWIHVNSYTGCLWDA